MGFILRSQTACKGKRKHCLPTELMLSCKLLHDIKAVKSRVFHVFLDSPVKRSASVNPIFFRVPVQIH